MDESSGGAPRRSLHASEVKARSTAADEALERITDGVFAIDQDLIVRYINQGAMRLRGRLDQDVVGRHLFELTPHLAGSEYELKVREAISSQRVVEFEDFSVYVGRWLWRRFYPSPSGVTVIMGHGESPFPRPASEELGVSSLVRAQASEKHYRDLLDGMAEGVAEALPTGEYIAVNLAYAQMLGYDSPEDFYFNVANARDLLAEPAERDVLIQWLAAGGTGGSKEVKEVQLRRRDGSPLWARARVTARHASDGELASVQFIVEDITQYRLSERALHEASEAIEARERTLLAEAVHDEPIQLIVAAILRLDGLQARVSTEEAASLEQIAALLEQAVERLRDLIVVLNPPDLAAGLGVALSRLADAIFMGMPTKIAVTGPVHVPLAEATKASAYRILREALTNARKHAQAHNILIGLEVRTDRVALSVVDDGVGAESFASGPGHIGMATMRARAEAEGAELDIISRPGQGTTVTLLLPRAVE